MRALTPADFLTLWEDGRTLHPVDQGLLAVHAAFPETRSEGVADWPIGRRNRALVELHCTCFGPVLRGWASCRQCREKLEFELDGRALAQSQSLEQGEPIVVRGRTFRLPTSRDLAQIAAEHDPGEAAMLLLERCRVDRPAESEESSPRCDWTEEDLEAVGEKMALADPLAEIMLLFDCPACGESFQESLDLSTFLWSEMEARAKRLLLEVHTLASAYGWSEAQIFSMSVARRSLYVEMVHA